MSKKLNYELVKKFIEIDSGSNCTLISTEYVSKKEKLDIKCSCGEDFSTSWDTFKHDNKRACDYCTGKKVRNKVCPVCKEEFKPIKKKQVCCSKSCANQLRNPPIYVKCEICDKEVRKPKNQIDRAEFHYCSNECRAKGVRLKNIGENNPNWKGKSYTYSCDCCGTEYHRVDYYNSNYGYCSQKCKAEHQKEILKGENNPNWKIEKSDEQRVKERKIGSYNRWRQDVFERDNYLCRCCGTTSKRDNKIVAHHILNYYKYKDLRTDVNNGITLCTKCHREFHYRYGTLHNNQEQIDEFIKEMNRK